MWEGEEKPYAAKSYHRNAISIARCSGSRMNIFRKGKIALLKELLLYTGR